MAELTSEDINHLAHLARLALSPEEQTRYAGQLSAVVEYVELLSQVDTTQVNSSLGSSSLHTVLATDQPREAGDLCAVDAAALLAGAPATDEGYILVRAVLGEEVTGA